MACGMTRSRLASGSGSPTPMPVLLTRRTGLPASCDSWASAFSSAWRAFDTSLAAW